MRSDHAEQATFANDPQERTAEINAGLSCQGFPDSSPRVQKAVPMTDEEINEDYERHAHAY